MTGQPCACGALQFRNGACVPCGAPQPSLSEGGSLFRAQALIPVAIVVATVISIGAYLALRGPGGQAQPPVADAIAVAEAMAVAPPVPTVPHSGAVPAPVANAPAGQAPGEVVEAPPSTAPETAPQSEKEGWRYSEDTDRMTGKKTQTAFLYSDDRVELDFPYQGYNQPSIMLRRRNGRVDAMFSIMKGQLVCQFDGCSLKVRFDDRPAVRYQAVHSADHDPTNLFLLPGSQIAKQIGKSRRMLVEVTIYQAGTKVFEFDVGQYKF